MSVYPFRAFLLVTTSPLGLAAPNTKAGLETAGRRAALLAVIAFDPESVRIASPEISKRRRSKIDQGPGGAQAPEAPPQQTQGPSRHRPGAPKSPRRGVMDLGSLAALALVALIGAPVAVVIGCALHAARRRHRYFAELSWRNLAELRTSPRPRPGGAFAGLGAMGFTRRAP